jgi:hypothetical protein
MLWASFRVSGLLMLRIGVVVGFLSVGWGRTKIFVRDFHFACGSCFDMHLQYMRAGKRSSAMLLGCRR